MLRRLSIRDLVLIEALDLELERGLTVLTGETGAGKSILLDALALAVGARAGSGLARIGADQGSATAVFEILEHSRAAKIAADLGLPLSIVPAGPLKGSAELILRRVVTADGRGKAFVNDQPVNVATLRDLGAALVEIHGQHDDRGLLNPAGHRGLLDAFAGLGPRLAQLKHERAAWSAAEAALIAHRDALEAAARDRDYLAHAAAEIADAAPEPGEEAQLDAERRLIKKAIEIAEDVQAADAALGPQGAEGALATALRRMQLAAPKAEGLLDPALGAVDQAMAALSDAAARLQEAAQALSFDPGRRDVVEERLFTLRGLARKYNCAVDALPEHGAALEARLAKIEAGGAELAALTEQAAAARAAFFATAAAAHETRVAAAARLDQAVAAELGALKLDRAVFQTSVAQLAETEAGDAGVSRVAFEVATNPGAPLGAIDKIASGGELSRFLLALKVALAEKDAGQSDAKAGATLRRRDAPVLIFDEIDRGVGGATADAVGERLRRLAYADVTPPEQGAAGQVLVVTHSAQVAAKGDRHWRIEKRLEAAEDREAEARTLVQALDAKGRVEEIARMISGEAISLAARVTAQTLLDDAAEGRESPR